MTIAFTQIVERAVPEVQFEINLRGGGGLPDSQELKDIWIVAERVAAGTSAADEVRDTPFGSEGEAVTWFGEGSPGAHMASAVYNFRGSDGKDPMTPKSKVWGVALGPPAGMPVAATLAVTFAGNASAAGTFELLIGGHLVKVGIESGDTPTIAGDKLVTAFNALPRHKRPPFAAVNAVGAVTFTCSVAGAHGNTCGFSVLTSPDITMTCTAATPFPVNGTLYPTLTTALANALAQTTALIVTPWGADNTTMEGLLDHANAKAAAGSELPCRVICSRNDTAGALATAAAAIDTDDGERFMMVGTRGAVAWAGHIAAWAAAIDASEPHSARSLNGVSMPDFYPPVVASRFTRSEEDTLLKAGVSPVGYRAGTMRLTRAVAIRTSFGVLDWATMNNWDYCRAYLSERAVATWVRMSLVEDDQLATTAMHVTSTGGVRAAFYSWLKDLEANGNLVDVDAYWEQSRYELDGGTLSLAIPGEMLPQWHQTYGRLDATV